MQRARTQKDVKWARMHGGAPLRFVGLLPCHRGADGRWSVLLGLEEDGWGAFGGGPEKRDKSLRQVAIREAVEESHGVLLRAQLAKTMRGPLLKTGAAAFYAARVPRRVSPLMDALFAQHVARAPKDGCFEKLLTCWLPLASFADGTCTQLLEGAARRAWPDAPSSPVRPRVSARFRGPQDSKGLRALMERNSEELAARLERLPYSPRNWTASAIDRSVREADERCSRTDPHVADSSSASSSASSP